MESLFLMALRDKWSMPIPSCGSCSGIHKREFLGKKLWEIGPFKGVEASKIAFAELQETVAS